MNIMQYVPQTCFTDTDRWHKYSVLSQTPATVAWIMVISTNSLHENQHEFDYAIFQNTNSFNGTMIES